MTSIIDTIDQAIADHELSRDAMRWTPNPPPRLVGPQISPEQAAAISAALAQAARTVTDMYRTRAKVLARQLPAMRRAVQAIQEANRAEQGR